MTASAAAQDENEGPGMLRAHLGATRGLQLLDAADFETRLRGVERLAEVGTNEALDALASALGRGGASRGDGRLRLEVVRGLAAHADREVVRDALVGVVNASSTGGEAPLDAMARASAALALAASGDPLAQRALAKSASGRGRGATSAAEALRAFPPASLDPLWSGRGAMPVPLATLFGELGDARAIGPLRAQLERKDARLQTAAAVSLARLGDASVLDLARRWMGKGDALQHGTALEVFAWLGAPDLDPGLASMLSDGKITRSTALDIASRFPSPELAPTLVDIAQHGGDDAGRALALLGRAGDGGVATATAALLAEPQLAIGAAHALGTAPGPEARQAVEAALASAERGPALRLVLRMALVRTLVHGGSVDGLEARLEEAFVSGDAADRAVGAFGLAVTGARSVEALLATGDDAITVAAGRAALVMGGDALTACLDVLASAGDEPSPAALACGGALLNDPGDGTGIPTIRLVRWAEQGGALAPMAALALGVRDARIYRPRLEALLAGSDPVIRGHAALGLGRSPEADATSLLVRAMRFETETAVRRSIVRGLAARRGGLVRRTLRLARDLDPDEEVRTLARAALGRRDLQPALPARTNALGAVLWVSLVPQAQQPDAARLRAGRVVRSDGLAPPFVVDPDGAALVPVSAGGATVQLAPAASAPPSPSTAAPTAEPSGASAAPATDLDAPAETNP